MLKTVGNPSTRYGNQTIVGGNLVIGTAGYGIDFSADPSSPGMTSELLDDYEEGTFTPNLFTYGPGASDPTFTGFTAAGKYTKIGRQVFGTAVFSWTTRTGGNTFLAVGGLPFSIVDEASFSGVMKFPSAYAAGTGIDDSFYQNMILPRPFGLGNNAFKFGFAQALNVVGDLAATDLINGASSFEISFSYIV